MWWRWSVWHTVSTKYLLQKCLVHRSRIDEKREKSLSVRSSMGDTAKVLHWSYGPWPPLFIYFCVSNQIMRAPLFVIGSRVIEKKNEIYKICPSSAYILFANRNSTRLSRTKSFLRIIFNHHRNGWHKTLLHLFQLAAFGRMYIFLWYEKKAIMLIRQATWRLCMGRPYSITCIYVSILTRLKKIIATKREK